MDLLEKIFTALAFTHDQKERVRKDFDVLVRARTVEQLLAELPAEERQKLNAENAGDALKDFYTIEAIQGQTRIQIQKALKEYIEFLLQNGSEQEKEAIQNIVRAM
ncbi:hypothetical protein C4552_01935 [Candidatus Parcubacteria bacterium]|nr:MAG: hypothetical protein C4552_01935 [Candidatus Parcubacteria bacterium]